ncbi:MAG: hypothetical protein RLZZ428_336 [Pseudomonadota bacterium]|jgi:chromosome segregation ATPase
MSALQKLQEKIEQWKSGYEALKQENTQLKTQLSMVSGSQNEYESQMATLKREVEAKNAELAEKDAEIEKIIAQVESLLA